MTSNCHHGCSPSFLSETTQDPLLSRHSSKGPVRARACPCARLHFSGFKTWSPDLESYVWLLC